MAVLSFAHLKKKSVKKGPGTKTVIVHGKEEKAVPAPVNQTGVMSFAHLKKGAKPVGKQARKVIKKPVAKQARKVIKKPVVKEQENGPRKDKQEPRIFRFPAVMKTARLMSTNFCQFCPRFLPASKWEKENGNPYGRCLRKGDIDSETEEELWRVIPARATVKRCYFYINEKR